MAGGIFSSMNKVRPGAYINFESQAQSSNEIGIRGIATLAVPLSWGEEGKLIELSGADMVNGASLAKIGLMANEKEALLFNLALQNCGLLKIYKLNKGGAKASKTLDSGLVITAKHNGAFGNKIAILIKSATNSFIIETYANGYLVDSQKVTSIDGLVPNNFVIFSGTGTLAETSATLLEGGEDVEFAESADDYDEYFEALRTTKWNTMASVSDNDDINAKVVAFVKEMRESEGKYVQAVIPNYDSADYEGIINNVNGVILNGETTVEAKDFTAWVAGATAGADIVESLTGKVVENATSIVNSLTSAEIIDALGEGKFILSLNQNGSVKVEKDINSLHTFDIDKGYIFSRNRIIRELDDIGSSIENIWETTYLGKVSNTEDGRTLFKSSIIDYLSGLQNKGAIQAFDKNSVVVEAGPDIDSVVASIAVKPVDSMEFLYMTVNVNQ